VVHPNPPNPPSPSHKLTPEQLSMIKKLVAAQQQCNQRSFTDRIKVTVKTLLVYPKQEKVKFGESRLWVNYLGEQRYFRPCICGIKE